MELIERIMSKVVGKEISVEEQLEVAGGQVDICEQSDGWTSYFQGGMPICDHG
jgi:hypothetical protein